MGKVNKSVAKIVEEINKRIQEEKEKPQIHKNRRHAGRIAVENDHNFPLNTSKLKNKIPKGNVSERFIYKLEGLNERRFKKTDTCVKNHAKTECEKKYKNKVTFAESIVSDVFYYESSSFMIDSSKSNKTSDFEPTLSIKTSSHVKKGMEASNKPSEKIDTKIDAYASRRDPYAFDKTHQKPKKHSISDIRTEMEAIKKTVSIKRLIDMFESKIKESLIRTS